MKRSLFSLAAGCLAALVINSFTARPIWGAIFHRPAHDCSSSLASVPGKASRALAASRNTALRPATCELPDIGR